MNDMSLTPKDLQVLTVLIDDRLDQKLLPIKNDLEALDYKIDNHYDKLHDDITAVQTVADRIERVQAAEVGRADRLGLGMQRINRELGLA